MDRCMAEGAFQLYHQKLSNITYASCEQENKSLKRRISKCIIKGWKIKEIIKKFVKCRKGKENKRQKKARGDKKAQYFANEL